MKLISLMLLLVLTGCYKTTNGSVDDSSSSIYKYYDKENNVVCYAYYTHGISCVQLKKEDHEQIYWHEGGVN